MEKVIVEKLPLTREIAGAKRWDEERGEFVQVAYQEEMRHLAVFEIRKGFSRGDHFHERKEEIFYIFGGKIRAIFMDIDTLQKEERILEKGDRLRLKPRCGHIFLAMEDTLVVEYSPQALIPRTITKSTSSEQGALPFIENSMAQSACLPQAGIVHSVTTEDKKFFLTVRPCRSLDHLRLLPVMTISSNSLFHESFLASPSISFASFSASDR